MNKFIQLKKYGGVENLEIKTGDKPTINDSDVLISHSYIAINYDEVHKRKGDIKIKLPTILGTEGLGIVEDKGKDVKWTTLMPGDSVIYGTGPDGAYSKYRNIDPYFIVKLPTDIDHLTAIGCFSKALTATYLLKKVVKIVPGQTVLIHGAAGGNGHILCQMANYFGLQVYATVKGESQKKYLEGLGCCKTVINTESQDFTQIVNDLTGKIGVDVVYDFLGGDFIKKSLKCINFFGLHISVGDILGRPKKVNLTLLDDRCSYITRTRLDLYRFLKLELAVTSEDIFDMIRKKVIVPTINTYNFDDIKKAHQDMESGAKIGSYVLKC